MLKRNLPQEGIAVHSFKDATTIMRILVENGNCAMLSREEQLWIVNWVWCDSGYANRNDVIFGNRAESDCNWWDFIKSHPEIVWRDDEE